MSPPDLKTTGGSALVLRMPCTSTRLPPTFLTKSATCVVVATTVSSAPLASESPFPQPVAAVTATAVQSTSADILRMTLILTARHRTGGGNRGPRPAGPTDDEVPERAARRSRRH